MIVLFFLIPDTFWAGEQQIGNSNLEVSFNDRTALFTVRDLRNGKIWQQYPLSKPLSVKKVKQDKNTLSITFEGELPFQAFVSLTAASGLEVTLKAKQQTAFSELHFPAAFRTDTDDYYLLSTDGAGMLLPLADQAYPLGGGMPYFCGGGLSMPWMGVTDVQFQSGYMAILETPYDVALCTIRKEGLIAFEPVWMPSLGAFGYERKITYHFFDQGGYVAQCKTYRDYFRAKHPVQTLREKQEKMPAIGKMLGAPHIYVWDTAREAGFARDMKTAGIDKALILWNANHTPYPEPGYDELLKELGYGTGGYELFSDLHKRDTAYYEHDWQGPRRYRYTAYPGLFNELVTRKKDGSTNFNQFGHTACPSVMLPHIENRVSRTLKEYPHECFFVDVYQANGLFECYSKEHPLTREGYADALMQNLKYLEDTYGQYTGGEWGADFAVPHSIFVHGMMTLQRTWFGSDIDREGTIYYYGNWRNNSRPSIMLGTRTAPDTYLQYSINEYTRVPLYELVHHDAVVTSWRWEDGNHHTPEIWWKKDLFNILYGSAPLWSIDRDRWEAYRTTFIESYRTVCPWLQKIAYDEMVSHRFLTDDHKVQMSEFSSGHSVVVNFSDTDYLYKGKTIKKRSFLELSR